MYRHGYDILVYDRRYEEGEKEADALRHTEMTQVDVDVVVKTGREKKTDERETKIMNTDS